MKQNIRKGKRVRFINTEFVLGEVGEVLKVNRERETPVIVLVEGKRLGFDKSELRVISKR